MIYQFSLTTRYINIGMWKLDTLTLQNILHNPPKYSVMSADTRTILVILRLGVAYLIKLGCRCEETPTKPNCIPLHVVRHNIRLNGLGFQLSPAQPLTLLQSEVHPLLDVSAQLLVEIFEHGRPPGEDDILELEEYHSAGITFHRSARLKDVLELVPLTRLFHLEYRTSQMFNSIPSARGNPFLAASITTLPSPLPRSINRDVAVAKLLRKKHVTVFISSW
eukprot:sb/3469807/